MPNKTDVETELHQIGRDALDLRVNQVTGRFSKAVRSVFRSLDGTKPELIGSCFLLTIGTDTFAVSAAHVTDDSPEYFLFIGGRVKSEPVQMFGEVLSTPVPGGTRENDPYDTSFWLLSEDELSRLGSVEPITENDISGIQGDISDHLFTAYGYPIAKNRKSVDNRNREIKTSAFPYSGRVVENPGLTRKLGISGEDHLILEYKKRSGTSDGSKVDSPGPHGMSGGVLINSGTYTSLFDPTKSTYTGLLAGMLLEYHKPYSAILAVEIDFIISLIRRWQNR